MAGLIVAVFLQVVFAVGDRAVLRAEAFACPSKYWTEETLRMIEENRNPSYEMMVETGVEEMGCVWIPEGARVIVTGPRERGGVRGLLDDLAGQKVYQVRYDNDDAIVTGVGLERYWVFALLLGRPGA